MSGHYGCNWNGQHEKCDGCPDLQCRLRDMIWFDTGKAGAIDDALSMYLKGYTFEEIYDAIGVEKIEYKELITDHVRGIHDNEYKIRRKWKDFSFRWDDTRKRLINSGANLRKIQLVAKG